MSTEKHATKSRPASAYSARRSLCKRPLSCRRRSLCWRQHLEIPPEDLLQLREGTDRHRRLQLALETAVVSVFRVQKDRNSSGSVPAHHLRQVCNLATHGFDKSGDLPGLVDFEFRFLVRIAACSEPEQSIQTVLLRVAHVVLGRVADHHALGGLDVPEPADVLQAGRARLEGPEIPAQRGLESARRQPLRVEVVHGELAVPGDQTPAVPSQLIVLGYLGSCGSPQEPHDGAVCMILQL